MRSWIHTGLTLCALGSVLCSSGCRKEDAGDSSTKQPSAPQAGGPGLVRHVDSAGMIHVGPAHDSVSPDDIQLDANAIRATLNAAGFTVGTSREIRQPFMSARGSAFDIEKGRGELQVFVYADANSRSRDTDRLDPVRVAPPTMQIMWRATPELAINNNVAVIIISPDVDLRRRVARAIER